MEEVYNPHSDSTQAYKAVVRFLPPVRNLEWYGKKMYKQTIFVDEDPAVTRRKLRHQKLERIFKS